MIVDFVADLREYCNKESFTASCAHDAVISMQAANYGRMRLGRYVLFQAIFGYFWKSKRNDPGRFGHDDVDSLRVREFFHRMFL